MNDLISNNICFFDDLIKYIMPIITGMVIVVTAIAGCWKYFHVKRVEKSEKILRSVYLPIMQYLIKQETLRKIYLKGYSVEKYPIIGVKVRDNEEATGNLVRGEIYEVTKSVDLALAPAYLIYLLSMYEELCGIKEHYAQDTDESKIARNLMVEVESKIREEVIKGFLKYHRRVAVDNIISRFKMFFFKPNPIRVRKTNKRYEIELYYNLDELKKKYD